ncbi:hypothetical protein [Salmonella sp. s54412]|uniref:hypothetical protein n=1 Tax=Salmonella sp. s54412 TaxID=3160128 RepID=UPI0037552767
MVFLDFQDPKDQLVEKGTADHLVNQAQVVFQARQDRRDNQENVVYLDFQANRERREQEDLREIEE